MKKGCFIKFIIFLTIFVAALIYIIQTKLDDWILTPGKGLIREAFNESWEKDMAHVKTSAEKDSLYNMINDYIDSFSTRDMAENGMDDFENLVKISASDSIIDKTELKNLRNLLRANNERSKKN
jgi:uncharacterized protein YpmS